MRNYREYERAKQSELIMGSQIFGGCQGGGKFGKKEYPFVLKDGLYNLFPPLNELLDYFAKNRISWWGGGNTPTGHTLSSQIACLNHLFLLRKDKNAVLQIAKTICSDFTEVLVIQTDKYAPAYISFEVVSDKNHLNENANIRGANCTSIDAMIYAQHQNGKKYIIPIEWKYTERYSDKDKSVEDRIGEDSGTNGKGLERLNRYTNLINESEQLNSLPEYEHSVYYFEPFYQLMRQTLWAEQMIRNRSTETIKADDYIHVHVIPKKNDELLHKIYPVSGKDMDITWRRQLSDQNKYKIITPQDLLSNIDRDKYKQLIDYLDIRYWGLSPMTRAVFGQDTSLYQNPFSGGIKINCPNPRKHNEGKLDTFLEEVFSKYTERYGSPNPHITNEIFYLIENEEDLLEGYNLIKKHTFKNDSKTLNKLIGKKIKKKFGLEDDYRCPNPKSGLIKSYTVFK